MAEKFVDWRKPLRSSDSGNCVEVGSAPGLVGIRDTKDRDGGTLAVSRAAWGRFIAATKAGQCDAAL
ncbi:DUF397 domain-containing protein [Saccharopolyspora sp. NPDC050389]|uniref:DUF397 domain-containing protein n=1 Tax=Saccharopolyspora sp. NPDC050389 TaxID=3155516 RepID=UPI003411B786